MPAKRPKRTASVEEYKVTFPQNAARCLEWIASLEKLTPERWIERSAKASVHSILTNLSDQEADDLMNNRGVDGDWDWKHSSISKAERA